jgi:two-component system response regulator YesN
MKRILVVDDERPVVNGISLIVKRELASEFEVVGSASSGREAIEEASAMNPDIVLMDVRMPGISGLEAIREMRSRGATSVFILVTAYERFDIAQEAVGLGVQDYLLKPVAKDKLAIALRSAASFLDRRSELERKEMEHREAAEKLHSLVESAFLHGIVLGEGLGEGLLQSYRSVLGLAEPWCMAVALLFLPPPRIADSGPFIEAVHARLRDAFRYRTSALVGPLFGGRALALVPLRGPGERDGARGELLKVAALACSRELEAGLVLLGFGSARPIVEAPSSWNDAMCDLIARGTAARGEGPFPGMAGKPFEDDEAFLRELFSGSPERARLPLEGILGEILSRGEPTVADRARMTGLFASACRGLARRGLLAADDVAAFMASSDFCSGEPVAGAWADAVRSTYFLLASAMGRTLQWSEPVARAVAFVRENYGRQASLELAADAVGLSPNRLSRIFIEETGEGFSDYLIEYRIERAKEMLRVPGVSIKQVSITCGYPDPNYFSRLFKKVTGLTPSAFSTGATETSDGA